MVWPWKHKSEVGADVEIEAVASAIQQELIYRPEYEASLLICTSLQETLRKMFGKNGENGSKKAILCVTCEYLYCASCLVFSALSAADALTAKEQTRLIMQWSIEAVDCLLLDPEFAVTDYNVAFRQMWNALIDDKLLTDQPFGYAAPATAVTAYTKGILPILRDTLLPESFFEACPYLFSDMEYLLESLVFGFPELFRPVATVTGGTISATTGYGLGLVEHYSHLGIRRAERVALREAEQAEHCKLARNVENLTKQMREEGR